MKIVHKIAWILLIIGGLNWGLMGAIEWGIGDVLPDGLTRIVYILVGLSAVYELVMHGKTCKNCESRSAMGMGQTM